MKRLLSNYRTTIGALLVTAVLGWLVHGGSMTANRAIVPLIFAWMFALHASDYRQAATQHAATMLAGSGEAKAS